MASCSWIAARWWRTILGAVLLGPVVSQFSLVNGTNIVGWSNVGCRGTGEMILNVGNDVCCQFISSKPSVEFYYVYTACRKVIVYTANACTQAKYSKLGDPVNDDICLPSGSGSGTFRSAKWVWVSSSSCSQSSQNLDEDQRNCSTNAVDYDGTTSACKYSMAPNAVLYKAPGADGMWVLRTGNKTADVLIELEAVVDDQKVSWLESAGATFTTNLTELTQSTDTRP